MHYFVTMDVKLKLQFQLENYSKNSEIFVKFYKNLALEIFKKNWVNFGFIIVKNKVLLTVFFIYL